MNTFEKFVKDCLFRIPKPLEKICFSFITPEREILCRISAVDALDISMEKPFTQIIDKNISEDKLIDSDTFEVQVIVYDHRVKMNNNMGFSNKSQLGGDSTLLNASGATNFSYRVEGYDFSDEEIETINAIATRTKIIDRIEAIRAHGADLVFDHVDNDSFGSADGSG